MLRKFLGLEIGNAPHELSKREKRTNKPTSPEMFRRYWDPHARALEINNLIVHDPAYDDLPDLVIDPGLFVLNPQVRQSPFFIYDELHWSSPPQAPGRILRSASVNSRPYAHFTLWPLHV